MKKLSILFLSVLALGLSTSSCSSDDDNEGTLEGKWELTEVGVGYDGKEAVGPVQNEGGCKTEIAEYLQDGKFTDTYSEYTNDKCNTSSETGTWTKDGSKITRKYTGDDETEVLEVLELTGSRLKTKITYTESGVTLSTISVYKKI
ncbi:lipocalin-like protein [Flavobacterium chryseum]|uniref:lipocalin family protein n=1 Tax=Flavobacterium sp. P3160 TaxID=2512113 RepID=UPI00105CCBF6|nr:lipocalin family protein [Flavobacterium sp. P3160]TDO78013.1 lipocalin-like protein [Flavobacterium sp. P3160]